MKVGVTCPALLSRDLSSLGQPLATDVHPPTTTLSDHYSRRPLLAGQYSSLAPTTSHADHYYHESPTSKLMIFGTQSSRYYRQQITEGKLQKPIAMFDDEFNQDACGVSVPDEENSVFIGSSMPYKAPITCRFSPDYQAPFRIDEESYSCVRQSAYHDMAKELKKINAESTEKGVKHKITCDMIVEMVYNETNCSTFTGWFTTKYFKPGKWQEIFKKKMSMFLGKAMWHMYLQNPHERKALLATKRLYLVELGNGDFGTGTKTIIDAITKGPSKWGNFTGKRLMVVRHDLLTALDEEGWSKTKLTNREIWLCAKRSETAVRWVNLFLRQHIGSS